MGGRRIVAAGAAVALVALLGYVVYVARQSPRAPSKPATPADVSAEVLRLTERPLDALPEIAASPLADEATYRRVNNELVIGALALFIDPLDVATIDERSLVTLPRDFRDILGREVSEADAQAFRDAILEDMQRRRALARHLLDLHAAGTLTASEVEARALHLRDGLVAAFRRITSITPEEHARLTGAEMEQGADAGAPAP